MDGHYIDGYALEVIYKPAIPIPQGNYNVPSPEQNPEYPTMPLHLPHHPPSPMWTGPGGPNPFIAPPLPPISPPQASSNFRLWSLPSPAIDVVPPILPKPPAAPPTSAVAPEPSPPPPYSALPPIPETDTPPSAGSRTPEFHVPIDATPGKAPCDPCNLFVKNLDDEAVVSQRDLEALFSPYGTITSTFLATYAPKDDRTPPVSKGFGFVAFSRAQEAELAKDKLHGQVVGRKKIFVSYAEKKDDRHTRLRQLFANMEKLAEEMKKEKRVKGERDEHGLRDDQISRRGIARMERSSESVSMSPGGALSPRPFPRPIHLLHY